MDVGSRYLVNGVQLSDTHIPATLPGRSLTVAQVLANNATYNVRDFGAVGDGTTDDTAAVQSAVAAAKAVGASSCGAVVYFPPGRYRMSGAINLDNARNVTLQGASGGPYGTGTDDLTSHLVFTQAGAGNLVQARSSICVTLRQLSIAYNNPSFSGRVLNMNGYGAPVVRDTHYPLVDRCHITGTETAYGALYGLTLGQAIIGRVQDTLFSYVGWGVCGIDEPSYSNSVCLLGCTFLRCINNAIRNAGEAWLVASCTFEFCVDGTPCGYETQYGITGPVMFQACWWGDASAGGKPWIQHRGNGLVCVGNHFGPLADTYCILVDNTLGGIEGVTCIANRFGSDRVIDIGTAGVGATFGLTLIGNQYADGSTHIVNDPGNNVVRSTILDTTAPEVPAPHDLGFSVGRRATEGRLTFGPRGSVPADGAGHLAMLFMSGTYPVGALGYVSPNNASNPHIFFGGTTPAEWARIDAGGVTTPKKLLATEGIGVGNAASATTPGAVTKKIEVFDAAGASIGFLPVYGSIS